MNTEFGLKNKGSWYSYNSDNIGQGREKTIIYMEENPEFTAQIEKLVREKLDGGAVVSSNSVGHVDESEDYENDENGTGEEE